MSGVTLSSPFTNITTNVTASGYAVYGPAGRNFQVLNQATLVGGTGGIVLHDAGTISNLGVISQTGAGRGAGVVLENGGILFNGQNDVISGQYGVVLHGGGTIENAGTIASGNLSNGIAIDFAPSGQPDNLVLYATSTILGDIKGFVAGDTIDTHGFSIANETFVGGTLFVNVAGAGSGPLLTFANDGAYTTKDFTLSSDHNGGTFITTDIACFAAGTRIVCGDGRLVAVEDLQRGDEVELFDGDRAPIFWIGHRRLDLRRHHNPTAARPVLIAGGALGHGLPWRNLVVSPDHALYFDGCLVPAKALINGFNIRQLDRDQVTYYHIELPHHAVLFAEGVAVESYLDTGNRGIFENGGPVLTLHPDLAQSRRTDKSCARFAESGPVVNSIRAKILDRLGLVLTEDPALTLLYQDGSIILTSRSAVPGELSPDPRDRRRLGVKIASLMVDGNQIPLHHPSLVEGWHHPEPDGRWTNGRAVIPAALLQGQSEIKLSLAATLRYPALPTDPHRQARRQ